jgi:hypothetical protein
VLSLLSSIETLTVARLASWHHGVSDIAFVGPTASKVLHDRRLLESSELVLLRLKDVTIHWYDVPDSASAHETETRLKPSEVPVRLQKFAKGSDHRRSARRDHTAYHRDGTLLTLRSTR